MFPGDKPVNDVEFKEEEKTSNQETEQVEVEDMRYDKNSVEALEAYKNLLLVDYQEDDIEIAEEAADTFQLKYPLEEKDVNVLQQVLDRLFDFEISGAVNEFDANVLQDMLDRRIQFFGTDKSIYTQSVSFAEVIIYWCGKIDFDYNYSLAQWAWLLINNLGLLRPGTETEEIHRIIDDVMTNNFFLDGQFGLFGLTNDEKGYGRTGHKGRMFDQFNSFIDRLDALAEGY